MLVIKRLEELVHVFGDLGLIVVIAALITVAEAGSSRLVNVDYVRL